MTSLDIWSKCARFSIPGTAFSFLLDHVLRKLVHLRLKITGPICISTCMTSTDNWSNYVQLSSHSTFCSGASVGKQVCRLFNGARASTVHTTFLMLQWHPLKSNLLFSSWFLRVGQFRNRAGHFCFVEEIILELRLQLKTCIDQIPCVALWPEKKQLKFLSINQTI